MKHVCYKSRKQLIFIYGEDIGSTLHKVIVGRKKLNKLLGVVENWFSFSVYYPSGQMLLSTFAK